MSHPLDDARTTMIESIRVYLNGESHERTGATKRAAAAVVSARGAFTTPEGDPDWLGRSSGYRAWVADTLDASPLPRARRGAYLAAVRHHVSAILHDRLPGQFFADQGLAVEPITDRQRTRRAATIQRADARVPSLYDPEKLTDPVEMGILVDAMTSGVGRLLPQEHDPRLVESLERLAASVADAIDRIPPRIDPVHF